MTVEVRVGQPQTHLQHTTLVRHVYGLRGRCICLPQQTKGLTRLSNSTVIMLGSHDRKGVMHLVQKQLCTVPHASGQVCICVRELYHVLDV